MEKIIAYYRVSTNDQYLGLEAQQIQVREYAKRNNAIIVAEYEEHESGANCERPQIAKAVSHAIRSNYLLVVAKLDRLARDVEFFAQLMKTDLRFVALNCEHANPMTLSIMMVLAQWEREQISLRTKEALAVKKRNGQKLGYQLNQKTVPQEATLRGAQVSATRSKKKTAEAYRDIAPMIREWKCEGDTWATMANRLNEMGHTTRKGHAWSAASVRHAYYKITRTLSKV